MASEVDVENLSLSKVYNRGLSLYSEVENSEEPTNSKTVQKNIADAVTCLENATRMVSTLGLFSTNEALDEVATTDLKYLELPALLGDLIQKLVTDDRLELLRISEAYYRDFLTWCKCYGQGDNLSNDKDTEAGNRPADPMSNFGIPENLIAQGRTREEKIRHYKEQKELDGELKILKSKIDTAGASEEVQRSYYKKLLRRKVFHCQEELENISRENSILKMMPPQNRESKSEQINKPNVQEQRLKPVLIVRSKMQKQVYGLGYPSIPVMSIEEFYEQKLKSSTDSQPDTKSLMERAFAGVNRVEENEKEAIEKENAEERDDLDALKAVRGFDDWKDVNRRGCGNRKNMG